MLNKKGLKCFGLLFLFFIIFGLSLSASSDVSALKYAYDAYPLFSETSVFCDSTECNATRSHNTSGFDIVFDYSGSSTPSSFDTDLIDDNISSFSLCSNPDGAISIFNSSVIRSRSQFNVSSRSSSFHKQPFSSFYPSNYPDCLSYKATRWSYDHIYGASYNLSTGDAIKLVHLPRFYFDGSDSSDQLPNESAGSLKRLTVPLNMSNVTSVSSGTSLEWDFGLVQQSANGFPYFDNNVRTEFTISYYTLDPDKNSYSDFFDSWTTSTGTCTIDTNFIFTTKSSDSFQDYKGVNFHCSFTPVSDMFYIYPTLSIYGSTGTSVDSSIFLTYDTHGLYFTGTYLITDGDDSWSGQIVNATPSGDNITFNPSYNQLYGGQPSGCNPNDWYCDFTNLFSFGFLNPFAPIFQMFSDNNSCASIPTLAGMLHSNETRVCPWFDSSLRNIVTPVLGLSSMMLVFGFAVRWLGSSSGNLFEDSKHEEVSNQGGRWGHYKKGGF